MTIALSAAVVVLGVLVFLLLGAQVELYRTVQQLREYGGLVDRPRPVEMRRVNSPPSEVGLPESLDRKAQAVVLFLSDRCGTCRSIAAALDGAVPRDLYIVVEPAGNVEQSELQLLYRLDPDRTVTDFTGKISEALNIKISPAAAIIENGRLVRATTVPSTRQLHALLDSARGVDLPEADKDAAPVRKSMS